MHFLTRSHWLVTALVAFSFLTTLSAETLRVAVFADSGAEEKGISAVTRQLRAEGFEVAHLTGAEIAEGKLASFSAVIFTGGSGSGQAQALGDLGREKVRQFVEEGNGYVGICAGAYLACSGFSWGIGVLDATTVSPQWRRGHGIVEVEILPEGAELTGLRAGKHEIRYQNGPILKLAGREEIADFETVAFFRTEMAENEVPKGIMVDSPAIVRGVYGNGRVVVSSPHPETTDGLEPVFISSAVRWVTANSPSRTPLKSVKE